jgi:ParB family chromosome partitioning protein
MSTVIANVAIERLHPHHSNIRTDLGDLTELAASIRAHGLLQPLVVTPLPKGDGYEVLDGNRRLAAAKLAGAKGLPCLAARPGDEDHQVTVMLAAALHKQLSPLDLANAFRALRNRGLSNVDIARRTGYSQTTVASRLLLLTLPAEAQDRIRHKEITVADAERMARDLRDNATGSAVIGPKGTWFGAKHRLAQAVAERCAHLETRRMVGSTGCGQCWEEAIRADEREGLQ